MTKSEKLTEAFNKGYKIGYSDRSGIPGSLSLKGSAEKFYWAGWKKGQAELEKYRSSPEYFAAKAEQEELWRALDLVDAGRPQEARRILNAQIGL